MSRLPWRADLTRATCVLPVVAFGFIFAGAVRADSVANPPRRLAIVSAAADGGDDRERLRYAIADAEMVAATLRDVGGTSEDERRALRKSWLSRNRRSA